MMWGARQSEIGQRVDAKGRTAISRKGKLGLALALTALMAACAPDNRAPTTVTTDLTAKSFVSSQGQSVSLPQTSTTPDTPAAVAHQTSSLGDQKPAYQQASLPTVDARPNRFLGLKDQDLRSLLGEPNQLRREAQAQIWQYEEDACVLDVYLYPQDGQNRVVFLEARDQAAQEFPTASCLTPLLQAQISG